MRGHLGEAATPGCRNDHPVQPQPELSDQFTGTWFEIGIAQSLLIPVDARAGRHAGCGSRGRAPAVSTRMTTIRSGANISSIYSWIRFRPRAAS